ncbi:MAG: hypothetical protein V1725_03780 [archaeon]
MTLLKRSAQRSHQREQLLRLPSRRAAAHQTVRSADYKKFNKTDNGKQSNPNNI